MAEWETVAKPTVGGWEPVTAQPPGFFEGAAKTVTEAGKAVIKKPLQAVPGAAEALAAGAAGLGEAAIGGIIGLGGGAASALTGGDFQQGFTKAKGAVEAAFQQLPLEPETEVGQKMTDILGLIPGAIHAAGETVFEKTGSALAAAGTEGLSTLLTLKPTLASKSLSWAFEKSKNPNAPRVQQAFDDLVRTDPESARELQAHVDEPKLKKELDKRISEITISEKKQVTEIFKRAKAEGYAGVATVKNIFERAKQEGLKKEGPDTGADLRSSVKAASEIEGKAIEPATKEDTTVYLHAGIPVTRGDLARAFTLGREQLQKIPVYNTIEQEVRISVDQLIRNIMPEALGPEASRAAAVVAKNMAVRMQKESTEHTQSLPRREFWNRAGPEISDHFIDSFEKGEKFTDLTVQKAAEGYRTWNNEIYKRDQELGLSYEPRDNYLYHTFSDPEGVARFFQQRFGPRWNDPKFLKERGFDLYAQAKAAGFVPKFRNPEDIMLARQHASDVAGMQVQTLRDMQQWGLARTAKKGETSQPGFVQWRSPNGERFWVQEGAAQILHNAFNTKSLWNMPGAIGVGFRGAMWLKNIVVPIKLAMSLFHPLHVQTIDNATAMVRASKELLAGEKSPAAWLVDMGKAAVYSGIVSNPKVGYRMLNVWKGKIQEKQLTDSDKVALQYITEGGLIPEMSAQYKNKSVEAFRDSLQRGSVSSIFHLPFALVQTIQKPMFEVWIPSLKAASYLNDVRSALRVDPSLVTDTPRRLEAFRRLAKSVENRYGEMAYNTLFWNRWIKDLGVASTLSLGWNLGFIREYGGAVGDIAKAINAPLRETAKKGGLDRPLFVSFYTTQALAYGGLMTWALTGMPPTQLIDYIYPKTGEKRPDGSDNRVNTMFYTREFASIYKHMENEGIVAGLGHLAASKASPLLDEAHTFMSNVNYLGQEISDPNAPFYKQLEQKLAYEFKDMLPISIQAIQKGKGTAKEAILAVAGFTPAPVYATESQIEGRIKSIYHQYHKDITPFERLEYGADASKLRQAYTAKDPKAYANILLKMKEEHKLTGKQVATLKRNLRIDPTVRMFSQLPEGQQLNLLKQMPEQERLKYLRHAKEAVKRSFKKED